MRRIRRWIAFLLGAGALALMPGVASAHEQRDVEQYHFVVGFLNEPAIQNQLNAIDLTVTTSADKKPVDGADKTLKAEVIVGGNAQRLPVTLEPRFGQAGKYAAYFMPTAPGSYIFHFSGQIDGTPVDQRFESGPNTFGDVEPLGPLQFPIKLADPSGLQPEVNQALSDAGMARVLGIVGIVMGVVGLLVALAALSFARSALAAEPGDK